MKYDKTTQKTQIRNNETGITYTGMDNITFLLNCQDELIQNLYEFRAIYNIELFNLWHKTGKYPVHKSRRHDDGEPCFNGEYFIVYAELPTGQITNHYPNKYWEMFNIPEKEQMHITYDGHQSEDVIARLIENIQKEEST